MKIYIITKGSYSDYHICNVTTNYKKAKRYKEAYSDNWGEACIEVYKDGENGKENYCWVYNPVSNTAKIEKIKFTVYMFTLQTKNMPLKKHKI